MPRCRGAQQCSSTAATFKLGQYPNPQPTAEVEKAELINQSLSQTVDSAQQPKWGASFLLRVHFNQNLLTSAATMFGTITSYLGRLSDDLQSRDNSAAGHTGLWVHDVDR